MNIAANYINNCFYGSPINFGNGKKIPCRGFLNDTANDSEFKAKGITKSSITEISCDNPQLKTVCSLAFTADNGYGCFESLTSVNLPHVTTICASAFKSSGPRVQNSPSFSFIPSTSLTSVGAYAFENCGIYCPVAALKNVGNYAFANKAIVSSCIIRKETNRYGTSYVMDGLGDGVVPSISYVGYSAFSRSNALSFLYLPIGRDYRTDIIVSTGIGLFSGCNSLSAVWMDGVESSSLSEWAIAYGIEDRPYLVCSDGIVTTHVNGTELDRPTVLRCIIPNDGKISFFLVQPVDNSSVTMDWGFGARVVSSGNAEYTTDFTKLTSDSEHPTWADEFQIGNMVEVTISDTVSAMSFASDSTSSSVVSVMQLGSKMRTFSNAYAYRGSSLMEFALPRTIPLSAYKNTTMQYGDFNGDIYAGFYTMEEVTGCATFGVITTASYLWSGGSTRVLCANGTLSCKLTENSSDVVVRQEFIHTSSDDSTTIVLSSTAHLTTASANFDAAAITSDEYGYDVDWGDGVRNHYPQNYGEEVIHNYTAVDDGAVFAITIIGNISSITFHDFVGDGNVFKIISVRLGRTISSLPPDMFNANADYRRVNNYSCDVVVHRGVSEISENAFRGLDGGFNIVFEERTRTEVLAMSNYGNWGIGEDVNVGGHIVYGSYTGRYDRMEYPKRLFNGRWGAYVPTEMDYLEFRPMHTEAYIETPIMSYIERSYDGVVWNQLYGENLIYIKKDSTSKNSVMLRGMVARASSFDIYSGNVSAGGYLNSICDTHGVGRKSSIFYGCKNLKYPPVVQLCGEDIPKGQYTRMFVKSDISTPPKLPSTVLSHNCYYSMFFDAQYLTAAPELPSTVLEPKCYYGMFSDCTSLTSAPLLPATTIAPCSYCYMFDGATSLSSVSSYIDWTTHDAHNTDYWLRNVCDKGNFYRYDQTKPSERTISTIPATWNLCSI